MRRLIDIPSNKVYCSCGIYYRKQVCLLRRGAIVHCVYNIYGGNAILSNLNLHSTDFVFGVEVEIALYVDLGDLSVEVEIALHVCSPGGDLCVGNSWSFVGSMVKWTCL